MRKCETGKLGSMKLLESFVCPCLRSVCQERSRAVGSDQAAYAVSGQQFGVACCGKFCGKFCRQSKPVQIICRRKIAGMCAELSCLLRHRLSTGFCSSNVAPSLCSHLELEVGTSKPLLFARFGECCNVSGSGSSASTPRTCIVRKYYRSRL